MPEESCVQVAPTDVTVAHVDVAQGFGDLGRFASRYRNLLGEFPSETRRRMRRWRASPPLSSYQAIIPSACGRQELLHPEVHHVDVFCAFRTVVEPAPVTPTEADMITR